MDRVLPVPVHCWIANNSYLYGRKTLIDDMAMVHWYFGDAWPHIIVLFVLLMLPG